MASLSNIEGDFSTWYGRSYRCTCYTATHYEILRKSKFPLIIIYIRSGDLNFTNTSNSEILGMNNCYHYISVIQQFKWLQFYSLKCNWQQFLNASSNNLKFFVFRCNRTVMLFSSKVLSISKPIKQSCHHCKWLFFRNNNVILSYKSRQFSSSF